MADFENISADSGLTFTLSYNSNSPHPSLYAVNDLVVASVFVKHNNSDEKLLLQVTNRDIYLEANQSFYVFERALKPLTAGRGSYVVRLSAVVTEQSFRNGITWQSYVNINIVGALSAVRVGGVFTAPPSAEPYTDPLGRASELEVNRSWYFEVE